MLESRLGTKWTALLAARVRTEEIVGRLCAALADLHDANCSVVVTGSLGRAEATEGRHELVLRCPSETEDADSRLWSVLMKPIGFSTGALAKGDFATGLALQRRLSRVDAVELSALRDHELPRLVGAIPNLDLDEFETSPFTHRASSRHWMNARSSSYCSGCPRRGRSSRTRRSCRHPRSGGSLERVSAWRTWTTARRQGERLQSCALSSRRSPKPHSAWTSVTPAKSIPRWSRRC
jgi:hypothetical protein